ncbi:MAG TPA: helix-turn-helix domain-containing protein [Dehalococcoidia bacterium]|nr:helix-turn-helix domain-containing protein [Dehalococcoidia bacterium]
MTTKEVADYLNMTVHGLKWLRYHRQGPTWLKLGMGKNSAVRYRRKDVEAWMQERKGTRDER